MSTWELILSWLLLVVPGLYFASKAERPTWEKALRVLTLYLPLAALFYFLQPYVLVHLQNAGTAVGGVDPAAAAWWLVAIVMVIFALAGTLIWRYIKPAVWWQQGSLIAAVVIAASAVLIYYLRPGWGGAYHTNYAMMFAAEWLIVLFVAALACWKNGPQNLLVIPLTHMVCVGMTFLLYYVVKGINLATKIMVEGPDGPMFYILAVFYAGLVTHSFLFTKGEVWHVRWSYKLQWTYIFGGTMFSALLIVMYIGGAYNQLEWQIKVARNQAYARLLIAKLRDVQDAHAFQSAVRVIANPSSKTADIANAVVLLESASQEAEKTVAKSPKPGATYNESTVNEWKQDLKDGASTVVSTAKSLNPFGGGSGRGARPPRASWKEGKSFEKKAKPWAPDHQFQVGEEFIIEVNYNPVYLYTGTGSKTERLDPGTYHRRVLGEGKPVFITKSDAPTEVSVRSPD
ncbi:MAG: hypothetical protein WCW25_05100 [Patescibacteria group bacterium]|jgi:hypothetical protein